MLPVCHRTPIVTFSPRLNVGVLLIEHVTAVTVSVKNKITLSLGVAVGSSIVRIDAYCLSATNIY
jgi:hypothetical protein